MAGNSLWEEALHDMVMENAHELMDAVVTIYNYKRWGKPTPDNPEEVEKDVEAEIIRTLKHIQNVAEGRGKKFIIDDQVFRKAKFSLVT